MSVSEENVELHQRAWGIKAARDWLSSNGYSGISGPDASTKIPTLMAFKDSSEALVDVVTQSMLFSSAAREAMYRTAEWKKEAQDGRFIVLFVPQGFGQNAKEALGLYDLCVEYEFL